MSNRKVKRAHEFRDPIHDFISVDRQERALVDAEPFQRLRQIHQLALTYNVYPGASHKRFEHSLGVMHLAGQVFDIVTARKNRHPATEHIFPDDGNLHQWRVTLRLAALCHDLGHLPFSHAAEKKLLPSGSDHETLTLDLIDCDRFTSIWASGSNVDKQKVKKLAVGSKKFKDEPFSDWEAILSEIIIGDSFGVDRIDYLLRDSYHLGVNYGRFDHLKLIDSLRVLPKTSDPGNSSEPVLGVEFGGLHSAEALLLARYFMYEQVYFHPIRRIYDHHLIEFMSNFYGPKGYLADVNFHLSQTDNEITAAMRKAANSADPRAKVLADRVLSRKHFRKVYDKNPSDEAIIKESYAQRKISVEREQTDFSAAQRLYQGIKKEFSDDLIYYDSYVQSSNPTQFPVAMPDGRIEESISLSSILKNLPLTNIQYVFAEPEIASSVADWIEKNRSACLRGG